MLVLQHISRNRKINASVVRYLSITEVRQDDKKSLSDSEKQNIRARLQAIKKRLLEQKRDEGAAGKSEPTISATSTIKKPELISKKKEVLADAKEEPELINKEKTKSAHVKNERLSVLRDLDAEEAEPKKKAVDEALELRRAEEEKVEEPAKRVSNELDEEDEDEEEDEAERATGKAKLLELIKKAQSEAFDVEEKVQIPLGKKPSVRPIVQEAKKAETSDHMKLLRSIRNVADELKGDIVKTEKELLAAIFKSRGSEESEKKRLAQPTRGNISSVLDDMQVDNTKEKPEASSISEIQGALLRLKQLHQRRSTEIYGATRRPFDRGSIDPLEGKEFPLFLAPPLDIFDPEYKSSLRSDAELETYSKIKEKELKKLVTLAPRNIYEEMIKWTNDGKLWHFPIDNEWKWEWEDKVDFSEHVLLEQHLEPWCPSGGPIRHFMELVCVGLGKNPYITAEEKREHIYWFRDYFQEKRRLLEDVGAIKAKQIGQGS